VHSQKAELAILDSEFGCVPTSVANSNATPQSARSTADGRAPHRVDVDRCGSQN
jgi:hypothetical protein